MLEVAARLATQALVEAREAIGKPGERLLHMLPYERRQQRCLVGHIIQQLLHVFAAGAQQGGRAKLQALGRAQGRRKERGCAETSEERGRVDEKRGARVCSPHLHALVTVASINVSGRDKAMYIVREDGETDAQRLAQVARRRRVAPVSQPRDVLRHRVQVGEDALALRVRVQARLLHLLVHGVQLLRGDLQMCVMVTLLIRVRHLRQLRQPAVQLRRLLGELRAVCRVFVGGEAGVLLLLVLEVTERLFEVLVGLLHEAHHLALLERWRDHMLPLDALGQVDRHAMPVHAHLLQRVGDRELLRAALIRDLGDELAARQ